MIVPAPRHPPDAGREAPAYREASYREDEVNDRPLKNRPLIHIAIKVMGARERHPAKLRKAARQVVDEYRAECDAEARAASAEEFRRWLARRVRTSACDQRVGGPNWRVTT